MPVRRRPPRRQPRSADTRLRIMDAALQIFGEQGYDGAMTRDIAHAAGVQQPLINYHFGNKEGLWRAAVTHLFDQLRARFADTMPGLARLDARQAFAVVLRQFVHFNAEHPELTRLMIKEATAHSKRLEWVVNTHIRPTFDAVLSLVRAVQQRGSLRGIDPASAYYLFMGAATGVFVMAPAYRLLTGADAFDATRRDAYADAVVQLFLPGHSAPRRRAGDRLPPALRLARRAN
ncbi:MAG: TetR family transcriptional regulator [Deltaproteobacteria bacterium]|nr:TetR family transcriptional regulator [Deltaproteobacteria bacterium]